MSVDFIKTDNSRHELEIDGRRWVCHNYGMMGTGCRHEIDHNKIVVLIGRGFAGRSMVPLDGYTISVSVWEGATERELMRSKHTGWPDINAVVRSMLEKIDTLMMESML